VSEKIKKKKEEGKIWKEMERDERVDEKCLLHNPITWPPKIMYQEIYSRKKTFCEHFSRRVSVATIVETKSRKKLLLFSVSLMCICSKLKKVRKEATGKRQGEEMPRKQISWLIPSQLPPGTFNLARLVNVKVLVKPLH